MVGSLAPARRRMLLAAAAVAVAVAVAGTVAAVTGGSPRRPATAVPGRLGPVLFVPGYGGGTGGLRPLAARVRAAGRTVEIVPLGHAEGDLDGQARTLARAAAAALRTDHAASVDVVGFSAGGVVTRLWLRDHGGAAVARRVITLGSPHHGTAIAALGVLTGVACPLACQQLSPDSAVLGALNAGTETQPGPSYVSIWTVDDHLVVPPDSARLAGALNLTVQSVCPGDHVSHAGLPADPVVEGMIVAELGTGPPVPLTAADCRRFSS